MHNPLAGPSTLSAKCESEMHDVELSESAEPKERSTDSHSRQPVPNPTPSPKKDRPVFTIDISDQANDKTSVKARPRQRMTGMSFRYPVLLLSVLGLSCIMANIVCFNFTVLCMPGTNEAPSSNHTYKGYTKHERTWLFSAVAIGALCAVVPTSMMIASVGTKKIFFAAGLISSIATLLIPLGAQTHLILFLVLRFFQGVSFAACMPVVGSVTSSWSPLSQAGLFMSALTAFGQLSSVFSMPLSGQLCTSSLGWTSVFYIHGAVAFVIFLVWFVSFVDDPAEHALVSKRELAEINSGKAVGATLHRVPKDKDGKIPYVEILSTPSVWGVWCGALGDLVAVQLIHTFSPLYIKNILGYSVEKTGWTAALPVLFQFIVKVSAGHSSDRIHGISETTKLRVFNSIALGVSALFMIALAFLPKGHPTLGVMLITAATAMFGFNGGGFNKCAALVSRQYSHFVLANIQFLWCLAMLICPILVGFMLHDPSSEIEWRVVYILHAAILLLSNAVFCFLATSKPAAWTDRSIKSSSRRNTPVLRLTKLEEAACK